MLAADKRRKEARTVDRPASVIKAGKEARKAAAAAKGAPAGGGEASTGFSAFRAMAQSHSAYKPRALPAAPKQDLTASVSDTDVVEGETLSVAPSE